MGAHYGPEYDKFIARAGETSPERWRARKDTISHYKSGGALLDLGCSSGSFLAALKGANWQLSGIEMSSEAAGKARTGSGAEVFVGDILEADFPAESFDLITCFDVLEHVYKPREVMARVRKWLKPDGIFYFLVPNIDSAEARVFKSYWYGLELPRHLTHFSPQSLRRMAASAGLKEVSLSTGRNSAFEYSMRYVFDDLFQRIGISRAPLSTASDPGILWRVIRKAFRVSILPLLQRMSSLAGPGESIHVVLMRDNLNAEKLSGV
jgi:2-polyprenyl-3-methyl-5-hydroxy-6-metoxy-1,4-benzoquinol methylase